ncbi:MAG: hypothetical protein KDA24_17800 [Deltaproteobacteria bacterium]|nr:hypothetical protein [Deltaproteobacteria bacterium]
MSKRFWAITAIVVSTVLWLGVFAVPMTTLASDTKWYAAASLYGGSYVFFFAAIGLVGRDGYEAMKSQFMARLRRGDRDPVEASPPLPPGS